MQVSDESRWFWSGSPTERLEEWFRGKHPDGIPAGGGKERRYDYLRDPDQDELGIKRRGEKPGVEVKGLVSSRRRAFQPNRSWDQLRSGRSGRARL